MCESSSFWMSLSSFCTLLVRFEAIMKMLASGLKSPEKGEELEFIGHRCLRLIKNVLSPSMNQRSQFTQE